MNKIIKSIALLISGSVLLSSCYINRPVNAEETSRTITVSGSGSVSLDSDLISLKFIVRTTEWSITRAVERNSINTANVFAAIKEAGVDESDISTADYQITQDNTKDYPGMYTVKNSIFVVIRNTDLTGKIIEAAVKGSSGANGLIDYQYSVTDKASAIRQARTLAIQDAQDAASLLAGVSGCKLSKVVNIREDYITSGSSGNNGVMRLAGTNTTPIIDAGTITVTSNVTVTYELEN